MLSAELTVPSMAKLTSRLLLQNHGFRRILSFILSRTVLSNTVLGIMGRRARQLDSHSTNKTLLQR